MNAAHHFVGRPLLNTNTFTNTVFLIALVGTTAAWSREPIPDDTAAHTQQTRAADQPEEKDDSEVPRKALRDELLRRAEKDQEVRMRLVQWMRKQGTPQTGGPLAADPNLIAELRQVDTENRTWLKGMIAEAGWPGRSLVGAEGARAAWLLVQHADDDVEFQAKCLKLMQAAPAGEVAPSDLALLTDRVMIKQSGKQRYGTQVQLVNGQWQVLPLTEPERVEELRREAGLPPLTEYLETVKRMYQGQPPQQPDKSSSGQDGDR